MPLDFDPSSARPEAAAVDFDPSSAQPEAAFKFDAGSAVDDRTPELTAARKPTVGQRVRSALSPLLGETAEQKAIRESVRQQLGNIGLGGAVDQAVNPQAEKVRERGALATTWESANRPLITLPRAPEDLPNVYSPMGPPGNPAVAAGVYNAAAPMAESLTSPLSIGTFGGVGLLMKLAKGYGPAAVGARTALRAMGLGFGAHMASEAGTQAGEAVDVLAKPDATTSQKVAAVTAPVLTGASSLLSSASAFAPLPRGNRPVTDTELSGARDVTPRSPTDAELSQRALEAKQPLALPEPAKLPASEVAPEASKPAVEPFREGQEVVYTTPDGQEARGIVVAPTATGRVKITTQAGENIRVPVARVRELPAEVNAAEGFDPSSAVADIEVTLDEPDQPSTSSRIEQVSTEATKGEPNADQIESPMGIVRGETPEPPAQVAARKPADLQQAPGASQPEAKGEVAPSKVTRRIGVGLPAHGEPDLLNAIEEAGGVRAKSAAKNPGGEYDDISGSFTGTAKNLVRKAGVAPDQLAQDLHMQGLLPDGSVTTLTDAVSAAVRARDVARTAAEKNSFAQRFETAFFGNEHPREWLRAKRPVSIDELRVGDRFEVEGEKFKVKAISEEGVVTIEDGITREIEPGTPVYPDKGKITRAQSAKKIIEDFLPVEAEEPAAPAEPAADRFSLEQTTVEQQAAEATAAREKAKAQAQRDKIAALAEKPLTGDSSDVGQGVLLKGDEDLFSGESAESAAGGARAETDSRATERGAIDARVLRALAVTSAAGGGAAYGYSQGDTPEEKIKNALLYGALAAIGMRLGTSGAIWKVGRSALLGSKELPNMRKVSEATVNAANRVKGARLYGAMNGLNLAAKVLGDKLGDPVFRARPGNAGGKVDSASQRSRGGQDARGARAHPDANRQRETGVGHAGDTDQFARGISRGAWRSRDHRRDRPSQATRASRS